MPPKPSRVSRPRRGNLGGQAADRIRVAIVRGELREGQPLREVELCKSFGISRIPLREALHRLVGEGLVQVRPNRGAVVASMTPDEIGQIAEICRLIETHVLKLAVPGLTDAQLDAAQQRIDEMDATQDVVEWFSLNWRFHSTLFVPAHRELEIEQVAAWRRRGDRYIYVLAKEPARRAALNREHRAILGACRARRVERAAALLGGHLEGGKDEVVRLLSRPH